MQELLISFKNSEIFPNSDDSRIFPVFATIDQFKIGECDGKWKFVIFNKKHRQCSKTFDENSLKRMAEPLKLTKGK